MFPYQLIFSKYIETRSISAISLIPYPILWLLNIQYLNTFTIPNFVLPNQLSKLSTQSSHAHQAMNCRKVVHVNVSHKRLKCTYTTLAKQTLVLSALNVHRIHSTILVIQHNLNMIINATKVKELSKFTYWHL